MSSAISFGDANRGFQAGIIHGAVNTTFQLPPEQPLTPPPPSAVIPFGRDDDFVEREIFNQIQAKCAAPGSRTALVGLGGVGKSQLAIELAYRIREQSPEKWVFWVHASNAARFEQSYRDIANCVKVPGRQDLKADIFQLVHDWLQDEGNGRWFLILDNVDDAGFLLEAQSAGRDGETSSMKGKSSQPLISYVPRRQNGSVLISTRSRNAALQLVEQRDIIAVEPMEKRDALALLQKKLGQQENSEEVTELAAVLEYMPLAMVQAAAYISQRRPRCSVQQYLRDFRRSDRKRTTLLDYEGGQLRRDWEAKNSIIITWQISFDYIRQIRPSAGDLLALMSFYDRQGIPDTLLRDHLEEETARQDQNERDGNYQAWEDEDSASQSSASDDKFEDDVLTLSDYSFIFVNADGATFEMHGLVQLAMRKWLEVNGRLEQWKQLFISNLCAAFPTGDYENWAVCQALFPHAKSAAAQRPEREDSLRDWALLLYKAAWYAWQLGKGVEAESMSLHSMRTRKKILGQDHKDTLRSMAMVGDAYHLRGRWDAAEELEVQVMEMSKKKLGADHPDTLNSMANLASTLWNQGRWDAAEELGVQVMEMSKKKLGADHPDTLTSMANLASTYRNQGRWDAAEELEVQVMETRKKKLGADHPDTLNSMANLASTLSNQGRWDAAEELEVQVMEMSKKKLGADHPDTLTSMANLASTLWNQGRWDAAEELDVQVMEMSKKKLGADHPDTLTSMNNLAFTLKGQGLTNKAISLMEDCCKLRAVALGPRHPYAISSLEALATWRLEAIELSEQNTPSKKQV